MIQEHAIIHEVCTFSIGLFKTKTFAIRNITYIGFVCSEWSVLVG